MFRTPRNELVDIHSQSAVLSLDGKMLRCPAESHKSHNNVTTTTTGDWALHRPWLLQQPLTTLLPSNFRVAVAYYVPNSLTAGPHSLSFLRLGLLNFDTNYPTRKPIRALESLTPM